MMIEGAPYTIVGVMPSDFHYPTKATQLWTPIEAPLSRTSGAFWGLGGYSVIARLQPNVTPAQAQLDLKSIFEQIRLENPIWTPGKVEYTNAANTNVRPLQSKIVGSARTMLLLLLGVVSVVLLIACANVANLLLVRATTRQREMAIRAAIGGSRLRLVRQALTESLVLAILGAVCGVAVAWGGVHALSAILPSDTPRVGEIALNARVLVFTGSVALLTGFVFGLIPALRISGANVNVALASGGRSGAAHSQRRVARALVIGEIAAAVVLVAAATLLVRSVDALRRGDPGFRIESIVTARISPPGGAYKDTGVVTRFYDELLTRTLAIPGVERAAFVSQVPFTVGYGGAYRIAGQFEDITGKTGYLPMSDHSLIISPDYFTTLAIPILAGRAFTSDDRATAPPVAIVSESFAKKFWPNTSAIGQRIGYPWESPWMTIVGVARDAKLDSLTGTTEQTIYRPHAQQPVAAMWIVARTRGDRLAFAAPLRAVVTQIDATVPVSDVRTMAEVSASTQARPRFTMTLLTIFAGIALLLGVVGIYGLMSYSVAQRRNAKSAFAWVLGASPGDARRHGARRRDAARCDRHRDRTRRGAIDDAAAERISLRRDEHRPVHLCAGDDHVGRGRARGELHPGAARDKGRSDYGTAGRVNSSRRWMFAAHRSQNDFT